MDALILVPADGDNPIAVGLGIKDGFVRRLLILRDVLRRLGQNLFDARAITTQFVIVGIHLVTS